MTVLSIIPSTDIKVADIMDTLNSNGGSVNENLASFFTESANINKWARYKPQVSTELIELTEEQRAEGNFGITNIPAFDRMAYMYGFMWDGTYTPSCGIQAEYFSHLLPTGGAYQPFRLSDFRNYFPAADSPIGSIARTSVDVEDGQINILYAAASTTYGLKLKDIVSAYDHDWYLGCAVVNGTYQRCITQSTVLGDDATDLSFYLDFDEDMTGDYKVFLFLSEYAYTATQTSAPSDIGDFVPLTFTAADLTVSVSVPQIYLNISAYKDSSLSTYRIYYTLNIINEGNESYNSYSYSVKAYTGVTEVGEDSGTTTSSIEPHSTKTIEGSIYVGESNWTKVLSVQATVSIAGETFTSGKVAVLEM